MFSILYKNKYSKYNTIGDLSKNGLTAFLSFGCETAQSRKTVNS